MAREPVAAEEPGKRLAHLDRLKILLTAGVIIAHAAMSYGAAGTWIYEEDALSQPTGLILSVLVGGGVMFVLGLFFLIAGMLTTGPMNKRGPRQFLISRLRRLGIPVAAYALVVWPMLHWLIEEARSEAASPWTLYRHEFSGSNWQSLGTGPMWFVAILLVVTVGWCLWRWWRPASLSRTSAGRTVIVAALAVTVGTFFVRTRFPINTDQFLDMHVWIWPQSIALFVLGAVGVERGWISPVPEPVLRWCRWAILGAVLLLALLIVGSAGPDNFQGGWHWEAAGLAVVEGAISVSVSLLVLEWSRRHVVSRGRLASAAAASAYGAFVAQGPVLVLIALSLRPVALAGDLKFLTLAILGVLGSFACGWAAVTLGQTFRGRRPGHDRSAVP